MYTVKKSQQQVAMRAVLGGWVCREDKLKVMTERNPLQSKKPSSRPPAPAEQAQGEVVDSNLQTIFSRSNCNRPPRWR